MNQEQIMQFQMMEQEANKLNQQLQLIENNLTEIREIAEGLDEIEKKETKEILANIGKKIYLPVEIKDKKLIIEVGNKSFVKKSISETKELIKEQIGKLNLARHEITERLENLQEEAGKLMMAIEEEQGKQVHNHKHDGKCECEEDNNCECKDDECKCKKD
jgi:prefoldin alpha subunit